MACPQKDLSIAVLGSGFMGTAIAKGLLTSVYSESKGSEDLKLQIHACVRSQESFERVQKVLGDNASHVEAVTSLDAWPQAVDKANVILLGIPPSELKTAAKSESLCKSLRGKLIMSLLAGTTCEHVIEAFDLDEQIIQADQPGVIHVIPSVGAQNLDSVSMIADTPHASDDHKALCKWIFKQIGSVHYLPEELMSEATAAGATCNALMMIAVDAVTDASVAEGIPRSLALALFAQTFKSAAGLLTSGMTPESMKESMSVAKGITINAVLDLEKGQARSAISDATRNAIKYARSMS